MTDHPAPPAWPEAVRPDAGDWISGPSADEPGAAPVRADCVQVGDVLLVDGTRAGVTDLCHGWYWLPEGRGQGIAIGWRSGRSSGLLFRKASDILNRLERQLPESDTRTPARAHTGRCHRSAHV